MSKDLKIERLENGWIIEKDHKRSIHTDAHSALRSVANFLIPGTSAEEMFKEILESKEKK